MDYVEFHKKMQEKYALDLERKERQHRRRQKWLYAVLVLLALLVMGVLVPVVFDLTG